MSQPSMELSVVSARYIVPLATLTTLWSATVVERDSCLSMENVWLVPLIAFSVAVLQCVSHVPRATLPTATMFVCLNANFPV